MRTRTNREERKGENIYKNRWETFQLNVQEAVQEANGEKAMITNNKNS